jgi:hypothetical protein
LALIHSVALRFAACLPGWLSRSWYANENKRQWATMAIEK